jgi:hypothetical protein
VAWDLETSFYGYMSLVLRCCGFDGRHVCMYLGSGFTLFSHGLRKTSIIGNCHVRESWEACATLAIDVRWDFFLTTMIPLKDSSESLMIGPRLALPCLTYLLARLGYI